MQHLMLYYMNRMERCQELGITLRKQVLYDDLSFLSYMDTLYYLLLTHWTMQLKLAGNKRRWKRKIELFLKREKRYA